MNLFVNLLKQTMERDLRKRERCYDVKHVIYSITPPARLILGLQFELHLFTMGDYKRCFTALLVIGFILPVSVAVDEELLDECEALGLRAGGYAGRAACSVVVSKCPPKVSPQDITALQDPDFSTRTKNLDRVLLNVAKDSCEVLFTTSCESAALLRGMDSGGSCTSILLNGPATTPAVPDCPDFVSALDIFTEVASRLCTQTVPDIVAGPPPGPEAFIQFTARGGSGEEKIAGLLVTGDNRVDQVIPIRCASTESGQLTLDEQECVSKIPSDINVDDVHGIKIVFANPISEVGGPDHNIFITDGQVWFRGRNIWRSAIDLTVEGVRENENGRLDALRLGSIYWNEGDMYIPSLDDLVYFEAKGATGKEVIAVSALLADGSLKAVRIRCSITSSGGLRKYFQKCTGTLEEDPKDVEELRIYFNEEEGNEIQLKNGQFFLDGINVLWNAVNDNLQIEGIWRLRSGLTSKTGIVAEPNMREYKPE